MFMCRLNIIIMCNDKRMKLDYTYSNCTNTYKIMK